MTSGSPITIDGNILGWKIIFFVFVSEFIRTPALPTSDPVPAVVGIAIIGKIVGLSLSRRKNSR